MTPIEHLIVTLGLDGSDFAKGQQAARDESAKTKTAIINDNAAQEQSGRKATEAAKSQASERAQANVAADNAIIESAKKVSRAREAGDKRRAEESKKAEQDREAVDRRRAERAKKKAEQGRKDSREADEHTKRLHEGLTRAGRAAGDLALALTIGSGVKSFVANITQTNAELGRTSKNLEMAPERLSAWRQAAANVGLSAEDITSSLWLVQSTFETIKFHGTPGNLGAMKTLGLGFEDLQDTEKGLLRIRDRLLEFEHKDGHTRKDALHEAGLLGLSPDIAAALMRGDLNSMLTQGVRNAPSRADTNKAEELQKSTAQLNAAGTQIGVSLLSQVTGLFTGLLDTATGLITGLGKEENRVTTDILGAGVVSLGIYARKKIFEFAFGLTKSTVGSLAKLLGVSPGAPPAVPPGVPSGAPGASWLSKIAPYAGKAASWGGKLLGGAASVYGLYDATNDVINSGSNLVHSVNPMAAKDGRFSLWDKTTWQDPNSGYLLAAPKRHGTDAAEAPQSPGTPPPGAPTSSGTALLATSPGDLNARIDDFWTRWGRGLVDWLWRQSGGKGPAPGGSGATGSTDGSAGSAPTGSQPSASGGATSVPSSTPTAPSAPLVSDGGSAPSGPTPQGSAAQKANVAAAAQAAVAQGVDPKVAAATMGVESGFGTNNSGKTYRGPFQLSQEEFAKAFPGRNRDEASMGDQISAGVATLRRRTDELRKKLGREPQGYEVYLAHQQGQAGGPALMAADPNASAIDTVAKFYGSREMAKKAILGNIPGDKRKELGDNPTAGQFIAVWRERFGRSEAQASAMLGGAQGGQQPRAADRYAGQVAAGDTTNNTSTASNSLNVGSVTINAQTNDPKGHADAFNSRLGSFDFASRANYGVS